MYPRVYGSLGARNAARPLMPGGDSCSAAVTHQFWKTRDAYSTRWSKKLLDKHAVKHMCSGYAFNAGMTNQGSTQHTVLQPPKTFGSRKHQANYLGSNDHNLRKSSIAFKQRNDGPTLYTPTSRLQRCSKYALLTRNSCLSYKVKA